MTRDLETRARLLKAGERLFADRGFKKVTVRDICRAATANVAAVNYHFGDKLGLYREVLQSAIDRIRATNEAAREAGEGRSAEERLHRSIVIFVSRLLASRSDTVHRLIHREINDPTPALDALVDQGIRPRFDYLAGVVAEIIGCPPSDPTVLRSVASIQAQSIAYLPHPIAARVGLPLKPATPAQVDAIAEHIAEFSVAGVQAIARAKGARAVTVSRARGRAASVRLSTSTEPTAD
jgi:AcrR family transcriptional regulator